MTAKRLKDIRNIAKLALLVSASAGLWGCQQDNFYDRDETGFFTGTPELEFKATVSDNGTVTRALTQQPVNVEPNEFGGYFYIQVYDPTYVKPDNPDASKSKFGQYKVPIDGNGGVLKYEGEINNKPNWFTIDDNHYFWSWTLPWLEAASENGITVQHWGNDVDENGMVISTSRAGDDDTGDGSDTGDNNGDDDGDDNGEGGEGGEENPSHPVVPVDPIPFLNTRPIRIKLQNTSADEFTYINTEEKKDSSWNYGSWGNGYFFEKFIGAKSGPYDFRRNGVEVPLQFRHLMSKISVRSLLFQRANGATLEDIPANLTFFNMPDEFTFYPHPTRADVEANPNNPYIKEDGPPIVVTNQASAKPNSGIKFGFTNPIDQLPDEHPDNKVQYRDKFYICPEVDFSKVSFMIEFLDPQFMGKGEYYGDFSSVAFERDPGTDYDNDSGIVDSNGEPVDDSRVLHAGETMYFDLLVREYGGGGYTIYVRGWSTRPNQQTKHYPHPGIYIDGEATELIGSQSDATKFDLYGDGFLDGKNEPATPELPNHLGVYHLYNDIDMGNRTAFPLSKEYVFNGMGHILKFSPTSDTTKVTIGKMIDVYIEINGYTIFIDEEGWICTLNPTTGKYERTQNQINLEGDKNTFTIDVATGALT